MGLQSRQTNTLRRRCQTPRQCQLRRAHSRTQTSPRDPAPSPIAPAANHRTLLLSAVLPPRLRPSPLRPAATREVVPLHSSMALCHGSPGRRNLRSAPNTQQCDVALRNSYLTPAYQPGSSFCVPDARIIESACCAIEGTEALAEAVKSTRRRQASCLLSVWGT